MSTEPAAPRYRIAVRALCEFTAKQGDLDLRFTPAPTALEGIEGHALVAARRGAGYRSEIALEASHGALLVRGRADGYDPARRRLEEVKTHRGRLDRQPANHRHLHWAQARVYGWLMCLQEKLTEIELALVYFDVVSQQETVFTEQRTAADLQAHFEQQAGAFLAWAEQELAHRTQRDAALAVLPFPHADFRTGQRALAEDVWRAARSGRCLLAQAPTGIGKTVGTLYPLLRAAATEGLDRIFFLTAKTSGRALALDALALLVGTGRGDDRPVAPGGEGSAGTNTDSNGDTDTDKVRVPVPPQLSSVDGSTEGAPPPSRPLFRVLELVARDKSCEHPDKACHGESCSLAQGFYDRLAGAREAALTLQHWHRDDLRQLAARHAVCPYYLTQELARWADGVVGDYNHFFDQSALLHALTVAQGWKVALLVDEAHNLVSRARAMYSATLDSAGLKGVRLSAPAALKRPLDRVNRQWNALKKSHYTDPPAPATPQPDYQVLDSLPDELLAALQQAITAISEHLAEHPTEVDTTLQAWWFEALAFTRLAETFGPHSLVDLSRERRPTHARSDSVQLTLRNVVPAGFLKARLAAAHSAVLFSATLQPWHYHQTLLGLPDDTVHTEVASPFAAEQLAVHIAARLSTRWQHRAAAVPTIVSTIADQYRERPGHYLAFFSSFEFLRQTHAAFEAAHPDIQTWPQSAGMSEAAQTAFLARFTPGGLGIGFAVLGGAFAEGIDLPGDRLIGAFIATLGYPQVNPVNEQIRARIDALLGQGFDMTYVYPGLQKVVQAAGRVIRTTSDRGVIHLLDERYQRADIRALLPAWWAVAPDPRA